MEITTLGLDLAKNVFQVHGISSTGEVVLRRALRRAQVIPFSATSHGHGSLRDQPSLGAGADPTRPRGAADAAEAEAICEAVQRPTMRFVPIKSAEQQAAL